MVFVSVAAPGNFLYRPNFKIAAAICTRTFSTNYHRGSNYNIHSATFKHRRQNSNSSTNADEVVDQRDNSKSNSKRSNNNRISTTTTIQDLRRPPRNDDENLSSISSTSSAFDAFVKEEINRARRSLLVRFVARSPKAYGEAYDEICKRLRAADISVVVGGGSASGSGFSSGASLSPPRIVHSPDGLKTFFLLETASRESVDDFIRYTARSAANSYRMQPCRTRILHFTGDPTTTARSGGGDLAGINSVVGAGRNPQKSTPGTDVFALNKTLKDCLWIDEQMRVLVDETSLPENGIRLRFFVASLIEDAFRGVFPNVLCTPFGSTTNGFGHSNCDLDMDFAAEEPQTSEAPCQWLCAFRVKDDDQRRHAQRMVELMGRMVRTCLPYCTDVANIVNARVPIVKFAHEAGGFRCDITADNITGAMCSKIFWVYSHLDKRVRPLLFTIRRWAAECKISRDSPGEWLSNFQLLCLVIHFLQTLPPQSAGFNNCALTPIKTLRRYASPNDQYGVIGDPDRLAHLLQNDRRNNNNNNNNNNKNRSIDQQTAIGGGNKSDQSLGELLREFFHFYGYRFDFDRLGIDLETGSQVEKASKSSSSSSVLLSSGSSSPLYIPNPLEEEHNIGKNVNQKELDRFRSYARTACKLLERKELTQKNPTESWGLLALFDPALYANAEGQSAASKGQSASPQGQSAASKGQSASPKGQSAAASDRSV